MLTWLCAGVIALQIPRVPVLKQELPSGTRLVAHAMEDAESFALHIALTHRGLQSEADLGSALHLTEHFLAKGSSGDLAQKLESFGCWVTAYTTREAIHLAIQGPSSELDAAMELAPEFWSLPDLSEEDIQREVEVIRLELSLIPRAINHVRAAWRLVDEGKLPDPFGDSQLLQKVSLPAIQRLADDLLVAPRVSIALTAPGQVDTLYGQIETLAAPLRPSGVPVPSSIEPEWQAELRSVPPGGGLALLSPPVSQPAGLANLAILLGLGLADPDWTPVYEPSASANLMLLSGGAPESWMALQQGNTNFRAEVLNAGYRALPQWLARQRSDPAADAALRATLMSGNFSVGPEQLEARLELISVELLSAAFVRWQQESVRVRL